jgi:hypothetical protein
MSKKLYYTGQYILHLTPEHSRLSHIAILSQKIHVPMSTTMTVQLLVQECYRDTSVLLVMNKHHA